MSKKPLTRTEKLICVGQWLHEKCQGIFTDRKSQHADHTPVSEGWALREPLAGAQMVHHKEYRLSTLCRGITMGEGLPIDEATAKILEQVVDGINYNVIILTGLVEDGHISIADLDDLIRWNRNES